MYFECSSIPIKPVQTLRMYYNNSISITSFYNSSIGNSSISHSGISSFSLSQPLFICDEPDMWKLGVLQFQKADNGPNLYFYGRIFSGIEFRPMMTEERFDSPPVVILKGKNHLRRRNKEEPPFLDQSEQMKLYTP